MAANTTQDRPGNRSVVIASLNPVKINAALAGFNQMFPGPPWTAHQISVPSGVPDQPLSDEQTLQGAINRAQNAERECPSYNYWIGIEGGLEPHADSFQSFAWVAVLDKTGRLGKARTAMFYQPKEVAKLIREGMELGHADDAVFGRENSKHHSGSVGLLTGDLIDRSAYYVQAVILALIPFKNTTLTF